MSFWEKLGARINAEPAAFAGVLQSFLAFLSVILISIGVAVPPALFPAFLGFVSVALTFWTRKRVTPEYNLNDATGVADEDFDLDDPEYVEFVKEAGADQN